MNAEGVQSTQGTQGAQGTQGTQRSRTGLAMPPKQKGGRKLTIMDSNLAVCLEILKRDTNQQAFAFETDPRSFGCPQSRPRIWIPAFDIDFLAELKLDPDVLHNSMKDVLNKISNQYGLVPLSAYVLPPEHPAVIKQLSRIERDPQPAEPADSVFKPGEKLPQWPNSHWKHAQATGKDWAKVFRITDDEREQFPGLNELTERSGDILAAAGVSISEEELRLVEVGQTLGRGGSNKSSKTDVVGCVTPNWRSWLTTQNRFNIGHESLMFMGISYSPEPAGDPRLLKYSSRFLADLAGNAFHVGQCAAMLVAMFTCVGMSYLSKEGNDAHEDSGMADDGEATLDEIWGSSAA